MKRITQFVLALSVSAAFVPAVLADTQNSTENTETKEISELKINAVALGNALNTTQKKFTEDALKLGKETPIYTTDGTDLMTYLPGSGFTSDWSVYSSVHVETLKKGSGITVDIATPKNITTITAAQYENAAVTAGIADAKLTVASAVPIDGSGALAGVYKVVAESGGRINTERTEVAQEEMNTLSDITQENKDKAGYSDEKLNEAQMNAKDQLTQMTADGKKLDQAKINEVVNQSLEDAGLSDIVTQEQAEQLSTVLDKMYQKNIFDDLSKEIDLDALREHTEEKVKGAWPKVKAFFVGIWETFRNLFN